MEGQTGGGMKGGEVNLCPSCKQHMTMVFVCSTRDGKIKFAKANTYYCCNEFSRMKNHHS